jgi:hypothetical protein
MSSAPRMLFRARTTQPCFATKLLGCTGSWTTWGMHTWYRISLIVFLCSKPVSSAISQPLSCRISVWFLRLDCIDLERALKTVSASPAGRKHAANSPAHSLKSRARSSPPLGSSGLDPQHEDCFGGQQPSGGPLSFWSWNMPLKTFRSFLVSTMTISTQRSATLYQQRMQPMYTHP